MSDCDRFDLRTNPHYHMRCVICGCVRDVDGPYDREYDAALAQKTGYQILRHRLVVEGICPDCQKKKPPLLTVGRARGKGPPPRSFHKIRQKPRFSRSGTFLLCKSIEMCYSSAPAGQPKMMHKNFMHQHLHVFVGRYSCMKFRARILQIRR